MALITKHIELIKIQSCYGKFNKNFLECKCSYEKGSYNRTRGWYADVTPIYKDDLCVSFSGTCAGIYEKLLDCDKNSKKSYKAALEKFKERLPLYIKHCEQEYSLITTDSDKKVWEV